MEKKIFLLLHFPLILFPILENYLKFFGDLRIPNDYFFDTLFFSSLLRLSLFFFLSENLWWLLIIQWFPYSCIYCLRSWQWQWKWLPMFCVHFIILSGKQRHMRIIFIVFFCLFLYHLRWSCLMTVIWYRRSCDSNSKSDTDKIEAAHIYCSVAFDDIILWLLFGVDWTVRH